LAFIITVESTTKGPTVLFKVAGITRTYITGKAPLLGLENVIKSMNSIQVFEKVLFNAFFLSYFLFYAIKLRQLK